MYTAQISRFWTLNKSQCLLILPMNEQQSVPADDIYRLQKLTLASTRMSKHQEYSFSFGLLFFAYTPLDFSQMLYTPPIVLDY